MMVLVIIGILVVVFLIIGLMNVETKKEKKNEASEVADVFRRIGYGDRKAINEDWERVKKAKSKWVICEAWDKIEAEFQAQGNTEAVNLLTYYTGNEVMEYLKEMRDFYEKADEEARNRFQR